MTEGTVTLGRDHLVTQTCTDPSSGTSLTYVRRAGFLIATVGEAPGGLVVYGQPERYGIDRLALAEALRAA